MSGSSIFESFERRVLLSAVLETDNNQPPADQVALTATATPLMLASNVQLEVADLGVDGVVVLKATVTVPGLPADSTYWPIVWLVDELQNTIAGGRPDQYGNVYFVSPPLGAGTHSLRAVTENLDTVAGSASVPLLVETTDQPDASVAPGAKMEAHSNSFRYPATVTLFSPSRASRFRPAP